MRLLEDEQYFPKAFSILANVHSPFPWQEALFRRFCEINPPKSCDIPTGLGKTSVIAIWLLALAHHARAGTINHFPRRLVYVVNHRTIVDQATKEAENLRNALASRKELDDVATALTSLCAMGGFIPLAISTLRGEFADNAEWRTDPSRPAIIVGTVDMIGSRLLFSGYGCGFKTRPLHAGFLGQDVLLVHDEAHLEPAFQRLIEAVELEQQKTPEFRSFRTMALTATARGGGSSGLSEEDKAHPVVKARVVDSKKGLAFHEPQGNANKLSDRIAKVALDYKESGQAILVFVRAVDDAYKVLLAIEKELGKQNDAPSRVIALTGTMRGFERDRMAKENPVFARFLPKPLVAPLEGTVYLVSTSAGEVGVDMSADHMVCDLTPFDSMIQRFGRVNRYGAGDSRIDVVLEFGFEITRCEVEAVDELKRKAADRTNTKEAKKAAKGLEKEDRFRTATIRTAILLGRLPARMDGRLNANPSGIATLDVRERQEAFTPMPEIPKTTDILFDLWAATSIRGDVPGRPPVREWLHGKAKWDPPEVQVAWREEVDRIVPPRIGSDTARSEDADTVYAENPPQEILEDYPLKAHELLRETPKRVSEHLKALAKGEGKNGAETMGEKPVWLLSENGLVEVLPLRKLVEKIDIGKEKHGYLAGKTLLLPPSLGALSEQGLFDSKAISCEEQLYDVSGERGDRYRTWRSDPPSPGMRLIRRIDFRPATGEEDEWNRFWSWYVLAQEADEAGAWSFCAQELGAHLSRAEEVAGVLAGKLGLGSVESASLRLAAKYHDLGKNRHLWQRGILNSEYPDVVLAKSDKRGAMRISYRHELGSLIDISGEDGVRDLPMEVLDLLLHMVAAHHGRSRPLFSAGESFDPEHPDRVVRQIAMETSLRFDRLQKKYGRWGLAYLESLLRAVDADVSSTGSSPAGGAQ